MYRRDNYVAKNFFGLSASVLGMYEAIAYISNKRMPPLSAYCARRRSTRMMLVAWTLGLAYHVSKHQVEEL